MALHPMTRVGRSGLDRQCLAVELGHEGPSRRRRAEIPDGRPAPTEANRLVGRPVVTSLPEEVAGDRIVDASPSCLTGACGPAVAGLARDLYLLLFVRPAGPVAHQFCMEMAVRTRHPRGAVDVGLMTAGGPAVGERGGLGARRAASGVPLRGLDLSEPLIGQADPSASAVASDTAVVGNAGVDRGMPPRRIPRFARRHVTGGASGAGPGDRVVPVRAPRPQMTARAQLSHVDFRGRGPRCGEDVLQGPSRVGRGNLAEDPSIHGDDSAGPNHERRGDPRRFPRMAAETSASGCGGRERSRLALETLVRSRFLECERVSQVTGRASEGGARVRTSRIFIRFGMARQTALDPRPGELGPFAHRARPNSLVNPGDEEAEQAGKDGRDEGRRPKHQRPASSKRRAVKPT